jgi:hypothetical protein
MYGSISNEEEEDAFVTTRCSPSEKDENGIQKPRENKGDKSASLKSSISEQFWKGIMFSEKEIVINRQGQ